MTILCNYLSNVKLLFPAEDRYRYTRVRIYVLPFEENQKKTIPSYCRTKNWIRAEKCTLRSKFTEKLRRCMNVTTNIKKNININEKSKVNLSTQSPMAIFIDSKSSSWCDRKMIATFQRMIRNINWILRSTFHSNPFQNSTSKLWLIITFHLIKEYFDHTRVSFYTAPYTIHLTIH